MIEGTCLCGAIRFAIEHAAGDMSHCHCSLCRKAHGSSFATYLFLPPTVVHWQAGGEHLREYESSPGNLRHFCARCGSTMPSVTERFAFVPAGLLLEDCGTRPQAHIFAQSRAPWIALEDGLPQHDQFPPGLGFENAIDSAPRAAGEGGEIAGSCLCDRVRFEIGRPPARMVNCHCSRCRRSRAAAHATNLFVAAGQFRWIAGEEAVITYKLPEARFFSASFCSDCGALAPWAPAGSPWVNVPAGALDNDPGIAPAYHIHAGSRAPWFEIADALPQYPESPPRSG